MRVAPILPRFVNGPMIQAAEGCPPPGPGIVRITIVAKKASSRKAASGKAKKTRKSKASKRSKTRSAKGAAKSPSPKRAKKKKRKVRTNLSKAELEEFRSMLLEKRRSLLGDMSGIEAGALRASRQESSGDLSSMPTHPADIGTDNFEQEFTLGLLESERALLGEINEALARIEDGTFGICMGTGKPIGKARLTARPWAKYCIEYARMVEKGLVRPGEEHSEEISEEE